MKRLKTQKSFNIKPRMNPGFNIFKKIKTPIFLHLLFREEIGVLNQVKIRKHN
jgi:hypothetical protein